ncbi:MAG: hypothetical protein IPN70_01925 [Candidatus Moraniibacteriota bacterium]|nr:MAG: hypothetical protein IPN70_01925 [Candidatus Moranbacteria bacterium]
MTEENFPFVGNVPIQKKIEMILEKATFSHAYIFSGPRHIGKKIFAQRFSQKIITNTSSWKKDETDGFEIESSIVRITPLRDAEEAKVDSEIKIDAIRKARRLLSMGDSRRKKICIIEDAHAMNLSSQNALLKILEEPKDGVIFFLLTHTLGRLLPTIISRCEVVPFFLASDEEMMTFEHEKIPQQDFQKMILLAAGRPGRLKSLMEDPHFFKQREILFRFFESFSRRTVFEKLAFAEKVSAKPERLRELLEDWIEFERKKSRSSNVLPKHCYDIIEKIEDSYGVLRQTNVNDKRIVSALFLSL